MSATPTDIINAFHLPAEVAEALVNAATAARVDPVLLANAIAFESEWLPNAVNHGSKAVGYIQFMPTTAAELGTTTNALIVMSPQQQLDYVRRYFQLPRIVAHGPLKTQLDVYMAIFYPDAIGKGAGYVFPPSVQAANPGIVTAGDYYAYAQGHQKIAPAATGVTTTGAPPPASSSSSTALVVAGLGIAVVALGLVVALASSVRRNPRRRR